MLGRKMDGLACILADIERDIEARNALSRDVIDRIYRHYLYVKEYLLRLYDWPVNGVRAIEMRRSALEKQLDALKQEKRKEQVECWKDTAKLKEEFRRWFKDYNDHAMRAEIMLDCPRKPAENKKAKKPLFPF